MTWSMPARRILLHKASWRFSLASFGLQIGRQLTAGELESDSWQARCKVDMRAAADAGLACTACSEWNCLALGLSPDS